MNRTRRLLMLFAAAALLLSVLPPVVGASSAVRPLSARSVASSEKLTGPKFLEGTVAAAGKVAADAQIVAVAWPRTGIIDKVADGAAVGSIVVARARSNSHGKFTLRVDPTIDLADYRELDGSVNVSVYALGAGGRATSGLARRFDKQSGAWLTIDGKQRANDLALELAPSEAAAAIEPQRIAAFGSVWPCQDAAVATYNNIVVIVGEVYPGPHATADFQYSYGASSELGFAISANGSAGSWKVGGTVGKTSTATIDYPTKAANSKFVFQTTFQYKKFATYMPTELGECIFWGYETRPTAFQGGVLGYNAASAPTATYCSTVSLVPTTLTKDTANAVTFTNGVNIHGYIGIDLSVKTGYDVKTKIVHRFTSAGQLCGSNASWPSAARVVGK